MVPALEPALSYCKNGKKPVSQADQPDPNPFVHAAFFVIFLKTLLTYYHPGIWTISIKKACQNFGKILGRLIGNVNSLDKIIGKQTLEPLNPFSKLFD
jgi:hypothetical protein